MIRRIRTKSDKLDVVGTISRDWLLVLTTAISGFMIPFLVWLGVIVFLAKTVLAQVG
ncbi:MAG: hypothetical protein V1765_01830 [bacterium]